MAGWTAPAGYAPVPVPDVNSHHGGVGRRTRDGEAFRRRGLPAELLVLAVGHVDDMLKGNPDKPQYSFEAIRKGAAIVRIPLPDPNTMAYPK